MFPTQEFTFHILGLILLCLLKSLHGQAPSLVFTSISEGCIVDDGQNKVTAEFTANFTGRDPISVWDNIVNIHASGVPLYVVTLTNCGSPQDEVYCQRESGDLYKVVMNHTADKTQNGKDISLYVVRVLRDFTVVDSRSNLRPYPFVVDPVQETAHYADASSFDISSGLLPDGVASINYTVTGLEEPYGIKYSVSQTPVYTTVNDTQSVIIDASQRILQVGYEEFGPTCMRQGSHTLCRKGGIEKTVMFDDFVATDENPVIPIQATNLTYSLSSILEPYNVTVTVFYDTSEVNYPYDNRANISLQVNGSTRVCIAYGETGTDRSSECLDYGRSCYSRDGRTGASTEATTPTPTLPTETSQPSTINNNGTTEVGPCPCDCSDWKEPYTVILFIAMVIKVACGILALLVFCRKASCEKWPVVILFLCLAMVVTVLCEITVMCYQEISDCGLCDCHYVFILIEMIVTMVVLFFIIILLYKEGGDYFKKKWFHYLLLLFAVAMAAISVTGIVVVFCNKEIEGSGADSWHIIYLLIGIAMAAILLIGFIALFVCQGSKIRDNSINNSSNGQKPIKLQNSPHEMGATDGVDGRVNQACYNTQFVGDGKALKGTDTDVQSPRRLPPIEDKKDFNSIPPSSISSQDSNLDTTQIRRLKKKKKKKTENIENGQQPQESVDSKNSTETNSPRHPKIHPDESGDQPPAQRPLPSPARTLPPLRV